jgi:acid ceramidase
MFQELTIDLRRAPDDRWRLTPMQADQARELLISYKRDLGLRQDMAEFLCESAKSLIRPEHWLEIESLSRTLQLPAIDVALCNFYYDILKLVLGCTAFAVDTGDGVLHARNLDWWTENAALARYTTVCHFVGGSAGEFTTIGWPGFMGVFSGVAAGRFAVSLNAVLSLEPAIAAPPVVLLLRNVLEEALSFDQALAVLSSTLIPCDCLLLLTGTRPGELVVIERSPSRHVVRHAQSGHICVTNDYQQLDADSDGTASELLATSCTRLERVESLIRNGRPHDPETCFSYLSDPGVQMKITVQQMVFKASTGEVWARLPGAPDKAGFLRRDLS